MTRAVIYARYSSDNQRDASIEDQIRQCTAHVERQGWRLTHCYTDHAISGASPLRPGYQQLLEDTRAGLFEVVVAEALDRLSREATSEVPDIAGSKPARQPVPPRPGERLRFGFERLQCAVLANCVGRRPQC